jgi:Xaa-Pro aminopeptidase
VADDALDVERLRLERLARLQAAMRTHDLEVLVLANEPNVRYATGATAMPVYAMSTFVRCAVVPQEGTPILFEHANEWLLGMQELVRPRLTCGELATLAPPIPDRYLEQRYECMVHGIGLEEENPSVCHPSDPQPNAETVSSRTWRS